MSFAQPAMAVLSAFQTIGQIQNARFQAELAEAEAKDREREAFFIAEQLKIDEEAERIRLVKKENEILRSANEVIAYNAAQNRAGNAYMQNDALMATSMRNLSEDLNIIRTQKDILKAGAKGQIAHVFASSIQEANILRATGRMRKRAGYTAAVGSAAQGAWMWKQMS